MLSIQKSRASFDSFNEIVPIKMWLNVSLKWCCCDVVKNQREKLCELTTNAFQATQARIRCAHALQQQTSTNMWFGFARARAHAEIHWEDVDTCFSNSVDLLEVRFLLLVVVALLVSFCFDTSRCWSFYNRKQSVERELLQYDTNGARRERQRRGATPKTKKKRRKSAGIRTYQTSILKAQIYAFQLQRLFCSARAAACFCVCACAFANLNSLCHATVHLFCTTQIHSHSIVRSLKREVWRHGYKSQFKTNLIDLTGNFGRPPFAER